jgi:hypothetical protein
MGSAGAVITRRLCAVPFGKERPAGPRSHIRDGNAVVGVARRAPPVVAAAVKSPPELQTFLSSVND